MEFMPELMRMASGEMVTDAAQWPKRREELKQILSREIFGFAPPVLSPGTGSVREIDAKCCSGHGRLELIDIHAETEKGTFTFPLRLTLPTNVSGKCPVILLINFRPDVYDMYVPLEEIIDHGFAVADICYKEITSDDGDFMSGLAGMFTRPQDQTGFGKITLWAWAASRTLDYLLTRPEIDGDHVAVLGHSRLGKTALWCGAQDERFRYVFSNDSGCAGAALERNHHPGGETTRDIYTRFPYWFCENYGKYLDHPEKMPFDQHFLLAAIAPRFAAVGSSSLDAWADPYNEQLCCIAASPAWQLLDKEGYIGPRHPVQVGQAFHDGEISYHLRDGVHFLGRQDWLEYMEFIRRHW